VASQIVASETGNRLLSTSLPGDPTAGPFTATYAFDTHGNMVRMPHLPAMVWNEDDRLRGIVSCEVYFPFGSTSYQTIANQTDTPKRYRYIDKERDEGNDLYYQGARYYAAWLGRWTGMRSKRHRCRH
jgi:RHS repeat-associated protein